MVVACEMPQLLVSVAYRVKGNIVQAHNTSREATMISQKVALVGVEMFSGVGLECDARCKD